jgi:hypothetical protein
VKEIKKLYVYVSEVHWPLFTSKFDIFLSEAVEKTDKS